MQSTPLGAAWISGFELRRVSPPASMRTGLHQPLAATQVAAGRGLSPYARGLSSGGALPKLSLNVNSSEM